MLMFKDVNKELERIKIEAMMSKTKEPDDKVVVHVGYLDGGLSFYGPFDDPQVAEEWIETSVNPALPAGWAYITNPAAFEDEPAHCGSCGSEEECRCGRSKRPNLKLMKKPVEKELPASSAIFNESGILIGEQLEIS